MCIRDRFYTDSNGLEMQKRVLDFRPSWALQPLERVSGNYYPITSAIYLEDKSSDRRMTLMNDRAQGGSSLRSGEIELMIQRKIKKDDGRGVGEGLNDGPATRQYFRHYIIFSKKGEGSAVQRRIQREFDQPLIVLLSTKENLSLKKAEFGDVLGLNSLPDEVKVLMDPLEDKKIIVRLHNLSDTKELSFKVSWDGWKVNEMSLTANQLKKDLLASRLKLHPAPSKGDSDFAYKAGSVSLRPLEIATFLLTKA
eukprot:TRINITY_DN2142_c0_g3_i3.p1 TRINITY_DN2142_c0_g3~~TRINITY_DN2142_c0_g3_i3.p1  ORF type:complete len:253 (-),score=88.54 TRINITY_DN2142_c0_g3_i3:90-848(-)